MRLSCEWIVRASWGRKVAAVALLSAAGCSDDGLTPNAAGGTGADAGSGGGTGSVSTTVTASAGEGGLTGGSPGDGNAGDDVDDDGADDGSADDDGPGADGTAGLSDTGRADGSGGPGASTGDEGSSGDAGGSTGGDTGGLVPGTLCETAADCVVVNDCCACTAAHEDDDVAACPRACETSQCDAAGIGALEAECVFGHCQLQKVPCNGAFLSCDQPPPDCPDGMLPRVDEDASCWTGTCVPAEVCDIVPDCSFCAAGEACVQTSTQIAPLWSCWPVDPSCGGAPSCACMGEVCTNPFICGDAGAGDADLDCVCPVCG